MPREKESYRDNLERLDEQFKKEMLKTMEVAAFLGLDRKTVLKRYPFKDGAISKAVLARLMS